MELHPKYDLIIYLYQSGLSYVKIQNQAKVSPKTIQKILKNANVAARKNDPYTIDYTYFEQIDSHEKAYFLGLIMADGSVSFNRDGTKVNKLSISLQERDGYILKEFKERIQFSGPIFEYEDKRENAQNSIKINIHNERFVSQLIKFGITPKKSLTHSFFKNIPEEFVPSAILGYFDGDGSVSFLKKENRLETSIISSVEFAKNLNKILLAANIKNAFSIRETTNRHLMGLIKMKGNNQALNFYRYAYSDSPVFLARKKQKFEFVIKQQKLGRIKDTNYYS